MNLKSDPMHHASKSRLVFIAHVINSFIQISCVTFETPPTPAPSQCTQLYQESDFDKPITVVRQEHGGLSGFCLFGDQGEWSIKCYDAMIQKDYMKYVRYFGKVYETGARLDRQKHPNDPFTCFYDNGTQKLRTHWRTFPFDDVYCAANGWTNLPRERVNNFKYWETLSKHECGKLFSMYPEFQNMSGKDLGIFTQIENLKISGSAKGIGGGPTVKEMQRHAYAKCLMGGVGCDLANCAVNFCRLDLDGNMGHGEAECGEIAPMASNRISS